LPDAAPSLEAHIQCAAALGGLYLGRRCASPQADLIRSFAAKAHERQPKAVKVDLEAQRTANPEASAEASSFIRHWRIELS